MQADALFQLDRVSLGARLRDVTLTIPRGVTAVLGLSGAGKTSLLNLLAGFEKPSSGKIHGDTRVAWAPQGDGLWPGCTAREHLTECGATKASADALLSSLDLAHLGDTKPSKLSRGEQSRLALARALAISGWSETRGEGAADTSCDGGVAATGRALANAEWGNRPGCRSLTADSAVKDVAATLVLDEPLAHVDTARSARFWSVIREHVRSTGASLVFATHSPESAIAEAEHAICIRDGSVAFAGKVSELYENPASLEVAEFLGPANWFTPEDARMWLAETWSSARCVRPERLLISPAENGAFTVGASRFFGAFAETELRAASGTPGIFLHRPATVFTRGVRVSAAITRGHHA